MTPYISLFVVVIPLIGVVVIYLAFRMIRKKMQSVPSVALRQGRKNAFLCLVGVVLATLGIAIAIRHRYEWSLGQSVGRCNIVSVNRQRPLSVQ